MSDSIRIADDIWGRGDFLITQLEALADEEAPSSQIYETAIDGIVQVTGATRARLIANRGISQFLSLSSPRLVVQGDPLDEIETTSEQVTTSQQLPTYCDRDEPVAFELTVAFSSPQESSLTTATEELSLAILATLTQAFTHQELRRLSAAVVNENDQNQWIVRLFGGTTLQESFASIASAVAHVSNADRVSLLKRTADKYELVATSTQNNVDRRAQQIRYLENFATESLIGHTDFSYGEIVASEITPAQKQYLSSSGAKTIFLRRVLSEQKQSSASTLDTCALAAVMLESFDSSPIDQRSDLNQVVDHAICLAIQRDEVSFTETALSSFTRWSDRISLSKRLAYFSLAGLATLALLCLVPADLEIPVRGKLIAAKTQKLFAPTDAVTVEVFVQNGQRVSAGDPLLRLQSAKLDLLSEQIKGDLNVAQTELSVAEASRSTPTRQSDSKNANSTASMQEVLKARIRGLTKQQKLLSNQLDALVVRSPIDGQVDRWDVDQSLAHRVVAHGEFLMDVVSPEEGWQIRLDIPEADSGYVVAAHHEQIANCRLRLTSGSENDFVMRLNSLDQTTVIARDGQSVLRATVDVTDVENTDAFRVGATVTGSIQCGKRSIGFVWFRSLIQWWHQQSFL